MNVTDRSISSGSDYGFSGLGLRELSNDVTMWLTMMSNVNKGQGGFPLINFTKNRKPMCRGVHSRLYTFIFYLFHFDPKLFRAGSWARPNHFYCEDWDSFGRRFGNQEQKQKGKHFFLVGYIDGFRILLVWAICCSVVIAFKSGVVECHLHKLYSIGDLEICEMVLKATFLGLSTRLTY